MAAADPAVAQFELYAVKRALTLVALIQAAWLAGCGLMPSWHWEKRGASEAEYAYDEAQCKAKVYTGTDGMVTQASVRRMHGCLEAKGWAKVPN